MFTRGGCISEHLRVSINKCKQMVTLTNYSGLSTISTIDATRMKTILPVTHWLCVCTETTC